MDKLLSQAGYGSRSDVKTLLRKKRVMVNDSVCTDGSRKVTEGKDQVLCDGHPVSYQKFIYLMMNKPQGVISATEDPSHRTVVDLLPDSLRHFRPFPVGRLDIDTEGLLLLTNDGDAAHRITSPRHAVRKTYEVHTAKALSEQDMERLCQGILLIKENVMTRPARIRVASERIYLLSITEGRFHQVKRMLHAVDNEVVFLKRIAIGGLKLPDDLKPGEIRELTPEMWSMTDLAQ